MHSIRLRPADPARLRAALAELDAIARDRRDPVAADLARRARQGVERRLTRPAASAA